MTASDLEALHAQLDWMRPQMSIELPVSVVRELIALIETPHACPICGEESRPVDPSP